MVVQVNVEHFNCSIQEAEVFIVYYFCVLTEYGVVICPVRSLKQALEVSSQTWSCHVVFDVAGEVISRGGVCGDHREILKVAQEWFRSQSADVNKLKDDQSRV